MDKFDLPVITKYIATILSEWIKIGRDTEGLDTLYIKKRRYEHHHLNFTGCYTIWLTNQEETWYCTKIDQLFVKMERNIKASRKRSYQIAECKIDERR